MGKATSMFETFKDFPAQEPYDFQEQCRELGSDFGTVIRTIFNFKTEKEIQEEELAKTLPKTTVHTPVRPHAPTPNSQPTHILPRPVP